MTFATWALYVGTVLLFMCTPGPSHLLMLSVSASNGFRRSLATAAGDLTANTIQIILAGFGLAAALNASKYGFSVIKWLGVGYLVWLGARQFIRSFTAHGSAVRAQKASLKALWARGFITSAANPKAVVFFAALFPQFLSPAHSLLPQILVLGFSYILMDGVFLSAYGKGGSWLANKLSSSKTQVYVERFSGAGLIATALLLGLKSQRS